MMALRRISKVPNVALSHILCDRAGHIALQQFEPIIRLGARMPGPLQRRHRHGIFTAIFTEGHPRRAGRQHP
jgi:hypothetical protein